MKASSQHRHDPHDTILAQSRTLAIVGLSDNFDRPSYRVASYMQANDYRIIPVNPAVTGLILGEPVYSSLLDLSERVDLVTIFRRSYLTDDLIDAAIAIGASAIWLQIGVINNPGLERAVAAGLLAVQNSCLMVEHSRWSALKS